MVILCDSIPPTHFWAAPNKSWPGGVRTFTAWAQFSPIPTDDEICSAAIFGQTNDLQCLAHHPLYPLYSPTLITTYLIPADFSKYQLNHWLGNRGAAHVQLSNCPMLLRHNLHRLNLLCIFFCPKGVICLQAAQSLLGKDRFCQICAHPTCRCCWRRTPPPPSPLPPTPLPPTPPVAAERNPSAKPRLLSAS